jgi:hypothetical protein
VKIVTAMAQPVGEHESVTASIEPSEPLPMIRWIVDYEKELLDLAKGQRGNSRNGILGITELLERSFVWIPGE